MRDDDRALDRQCEVDTAFDAVSALAAERGMQVLSSEIVGFVPAAALAEGDPEHLRLEGFDADEQILERLVSAEGDRR